eukprot:gene4493-6349_t
MIESSKVVKLSPMAIAVFCTFTSAFAFYSIISYFKKIIKNEVRKETINSKIKTLKRNKCNNSNYVEICVSDIHSAYEAYKGGARSIELCANRLEGGITPSIGFIEQCVYLLQATDVQINVLIRPRPGDFVYSSVEFDVIQRDVAAAKAAGADGIVFGALTKSSIIDYAKLKVIRHLSYGMQLTFHRAFDVCVDPDSAIDEIIKIGCDRLLTSGRSEHVLDGANRIRQLVERSKGQIHIIAAAGVSTKNAEELIQRSRADAIHAGSSVTVKQIRSYSDKMGIINSNFEKEKGSFEVVSMALEESFSTWDCCTSELVNDLVEAASNAWNDISSAMDGESKIEKERTRVVSETDGDSSNINK